MWLRQLRYEPVILGQRQRLCSLAEEIEEEAAAERARAGKPVLGVAAILAQDPQHRPEHLDRSPAPLFLVPPAGIAWHLVLQLRAATVGGPPQRPLSPRGGAVI